MRKLNLDLLKQGLPGFSKTIGAFLAEAALVCLSGNQHQSGVVIKVTGDFSETFEIVWTEKITADTKKGWRDLKEATEYGATAIAILVLRELTEFQYFERMKQDEVGDYLVRVTKTASAFSFLEISGIWKESVGNNMNKRISTKIRQINKKANTKLELFTIVTEFSKPKTKIVRNELG